MLCPSAYLLVALVIGTISASPIQASDPWGRLATTLVRSDTVVVEVEGGSSTRGSYVSSTDTEIIIWIDGRELVLHRPQVVRVIKLKQANRHGTLVGAVIGGALAAALLASGDDLNPGGRLMFTSIGAATGAALGWRADTYRKREVVYVRP